MARWRQAVEVAMTDEAWGPALRWAIAWNGRGSRWDAAFECWRGNGIERFDVIDSARLEKSMRPWAKARKC